MSIKKKHLQVIVFSSLVIVIVLVTTLVGQVLYIQWKKDSLSLRYRESIYKITAEIFSGNVSITDVDIEYPAAEGGQEIPVLSGTIKNTSDKTISSLLVELSFVKDDGSVVYKAWFHPVGDDIYGNESSYDKIHTSSEVVKPGESISFRQPLRNCPKRVLRYLASRNTPDRTRYVKMGIEYGIKGMSVL